MEDILHEKQPTHRNPKRSLMASSAIKVAIGLVVIVAVLATCAMLIDEWKTVVWIASLGGKFWGAILVGALAAAAAVWSGMVLHEMIPRGQDTPLEVEAMKSTTTALEISRGLATVVLVIANVALLGHYEHFGDLSIYQRIAAFGMNGVCAVVGGVGIGLILSKLKAL